MHLSKSAAKLWTNYAAYLRSKNKNHILFIRFIGFP